MGQFSISSYVFFVPGLRTTNAGPTILIRNMVMRPIPKTIRKQDNNLKSP